MESQKLTPTEFIERYRLARQVDREEWSKHWPSIVAHGLFTFGGGALLGFLFGLSALLSVLDAAARNF